jgi:dienelactone hydrolase
MRTSGVLKHAAVLVALIACVLGLSSAAAQPVITATPGDVVDGERIQVRISGLAPGGEATVHASRVMPAYPVGESRFYGRARYTADAQGRVDLASSTPLVGSSYERADAAGLFWSMQPVRRATASGKVAPPGFGAANLQSPGAVALELEVHGALIARADVVVRNAAAGVVTREVRAPGVTGVFARTDAAERLPAIILLGGSEGGLFTARDMAPLLASSGYAVLGLGYFQGGEPDLASLKPNLELIPLELLENARRWLAAQRGVDATRIAVVGVSKGAEFALVGATTFPWITAVGAFAPSHVVWEGIPPDDDANRAAGSSWTLAGKPLPFVRWSRAAASRGDAARVATGVSRLTEVHLESLAEHAGDIEGARLRLEHTTAAVFIAAGADDGMWPSAYAAEQLRAQLVKRNPTAPFQIEVQPSGHQIMGTGWAPTTTYHAPTGLRQGGDARLDSEAQRVIWPKFLAFLDQHLKRANSSARRR